MDLELLWHVPGGLYAQSGDLDVTRALQLSYGLKVLWTSSFFGKLGLSLDSVQLEGSSNIDFTSLGLRFNLGLNY